MGDLMGTVGAPPLPAKQRSENGPSLPIQIQTLSSTHQELYALELIPNH